MRFHHLLFVSVFASGLRAAPVATRDSVPAWTRGGVCYEIFVRSFFDSDGNGIGDFNGLTAKLDYINDGSPSSTKDLGADCVWLMPVMPSPSYHGYDATDYYRINPDFGTNDDFRRFIAEAHRRGIHVLIDMVLNHESSEHPQFQSALNDTTSPYRSWFRWSATKPDQKGPWGQEVWHKSPVRDEYYYGIFWSGMPDLNYETPAVRDEAKKIARFWIQEMGVDGFRLDAVPYLVEEGDRLAGTRGTHDVLRDYAEYVRSLKPDAYTVGEVWDSVGAMLPYYPDQLTSHFAFELSDAIVNAVRSGNARALLAGYLRLQDTMPSYRWSPFLRNHDQTRSMTEFRGDVARAKAATTLLLTLPGLPFLYYGEEIGMTGDKPDERLRTPMQWSRAPSAGFTTGTPWESLQPDTLTVNVATEDGDRGSLLTLTRRLIHLRAGNSALASGRLLPFTSSNPGIAAYMRRASDAAVLVVANLSTKAIAGATISSSAGALLPRRYTLRPLLGATRSMEFGAVADGAVRDFVLPSLPAMSVRVYQLAPQP
jgi:alpha-amylase